MNKTLKIVTVLAVLVLIVLAGSVAAFARSPAPTGAAAQGDVPAQRAAPDATELAASGFGRRRGAPVANGPLAVDQEQMHAAIATELGITVEELEAERAEGTSLVTLAQELGVEVTAVRQAMEAVRETAINQALSDGTITAEQAEWLSSRPAFARGARRGSGNGPGATCGEGGNSRGYGRLPTS